MEKKNKKRELLLKVNKTECLVASQNVHIPICFVCCKGFEDIEENKHSGIVIRVLIKP